MSAHRRTAITRSATFCVALLAACIDHGDPTSPIARSSRFTIVANFARVAAETRSVAFKISYERDSSAAVLLDSALISVPAGQTGPATLDHSFTIDLAPCLADPHHSGGAHCTLDVATTLLDASGTVIDRQTLTAIAATPGSSVTTTPVSLFAPRQPLSVNDINACAIRLGVTYCWGGNSNGQLGDGTTQTRTAPVPVAGGVRFISLAGGFEATCGLSVDSTAACWGLNFVGEIGNGSSARANVATPTPVAGGLHFKSIVAAPELFCALTGSGAAYCWGAGFEGGLGDGDTTNRATPTPVSGGQQFVAIGAGQAHACGITSAGAAFCWGDNVNGDVGDGTTIQRNTPVAVTGGKAFVSITGGNAHTCALTNAGEAYCWGLNDSGELGDGTTTQRLVPTLVSGGHTFTQIQAAHNGNGEGTTCALDTSGVLYCWGSNVRAQLGDGTLTNHSVPTPVAGGQRFTFFDIDNEGGCGLAVGGTPFCWGQNALVAPSNTVRANPTPVAGQFINLSAGTGDTCGIRVGGTAACWGTNGSGALGDNTLLPHSAPQNVAVSATFSSIATSASESCAVATDGSVDCWGAMTAALGIGTLTSALTSPPTKVASSAKFRSVSVNGGGSSLGPDACGVTTTGGILCWGSNRFGQVGDGTTTSRTTPTPIASTDTFTTVSVRAGGACAVTGSGKALCWGTNNTGQLGNRSTSSGVTPSPSLVAGGILWETVSAGQVHTCGLTTSGTAACWGQNTFGQLGNGATSTTSVTSPSVVAGVIAFSKISVGDSHTCAVSLTGTVYCWGSNALGELGDGTTTDRSSPTPIASTAVFVDVSAGSGHTCAWTASDAAFCWGTNLNGQIGDGTSGSSLVPVPVALP